MAAKGESLTRREQGCQPDLFAPGDMATPPQPTPARRLPPRPATPPDEVAALAARLPAGIRLGTSSWSFPGWSGIVYAHSASQQTLAREGLAAYAAHPLLRTVGIDRSYYAPLAEQTFAAYAEVVPQGFRFLAKAAERLTLARFPAHARWGAEAGQYNRLYLDAAWATDAVIGPMLAGLGDSAGPLVFQFPPQDVAAQGGVGGFVERLHGFLAALPAGCLYAVEVRNRDLFCDDYLAVLADTGAVHCVNQHPTMPSPGAQAARLPARAPALVVRWMLGDGMRYEQARNRFAPFDRLVEPAPRVRGEIAGLLAEAAANGTQAWVSINNKAEGCAPLSAVELARETCVRLEG